MPAETHDLTCYLTVDPVCNPERRIRRVIWCAIWCVISRTQNGTILGPRIPHPYPTLGQILYIPRYTGFGPLIIPIDDDTPKYTPNWVQFGVISGSRWGADL